MPPKKAKDAKKDGKKGKKGKKEIKGPAEPVVLTDDTKDYYVVQIQDLVARVEKYQKLCDELEVKNNEYNERYDQMLQDKRDIVNQIKKQIEDKINEIADLNEQLIGLQQAKDSEKESYEQHLQQLRADYQETRDRLTTENMALSTKLASLEEFKIQRDDIIAKLAELERQLYDQDLLHKTQIYEIERKHVIDKDLLKKEMIQRVNFVSAEFRKASNRQMAETTKRTIRENMSINAQLTKISETTEELLVENETLKQKSKTQKQLIEQLTATERGLARKSVSSQKVIRALLEKCQIQAELLEEAGLKTEEMNEMEEQLRLLKTELESSVYQKSTNKPTEEMNVTKKQLRLLKLELEVLCTLYRPVQMAGTAEDHSLDDQVQRVTQEHEERQAVRRRIEQTLLECAAALKSLMMSTPGEYCKETAEDLRSAREGLLEILLLILNNSAISEGLIDAASPDTPANRVSSIGDPAKGRALEEHYKLGDVGFIPRPYEHISTCLEKMQEAEAKAKALKARALGQENGPRRTKPGPNDFADKIVCKYGTKAGTSSVTSLPPLTPSASKFNGC